MSASSISDSAESAPMPALGSLKKNSELSEMATRLRDHDAIVMGGLLYCGPIMREAADMLDRLASQREDVIEEWRPIETAPRDGTQIDLWLTSPKGALSTGGYRRVSDCWFSDSKWWLYDETKYATDSANCRSEVWNVTHWMKRPEPPFARSLAAQPRSNSVEDGADE